jgi:hypothetical protein
MAAWLSLPFNVLGIAGLGYYQRVHAVGVHMPQAIARAGGIRAPKYLYLLVRCFNHIHRLSIRLLDIHNPFFSITLATPVVVQALLVH